MPRFLTSSRRGRKLLMPVATVILLVTLAFLCLTRSHVPNPQFEGRPVSAWFNDLCSGVFGGTARGAGFANAYSAFTRMNSDVVPYLTNQLRFGRSGYTENVLLRLKRLSLTAPVVNSVILPSSRRAYAATALRQMGGAAASAVPALLEAWKHDQPDVAVGAVAALGAILYGKAPDGMMLPEWKAFEAQVVSDAAKRCPEFARTLGIHLNQETGQDSQHF